MKATRLTLMALGVVALSALIIGCGGEETGAVAAPVPTPVSLPPIEPVKAEAGVPVASMLDPNFDRTRALAQTRDFGRRSDPFALLSMERAFERQQQLERVASTTGGWFSSEFDVEDPDAGAQRVVIEQQPYRRLSGVLLGNGVAALIEMEDGRVYEVVPGSQIPGTPWVVISIDAERAVLRRGGSTLPKEIIVRLGPRLSDFTGGGGGGGDTPGAAGGARDDDGRGGSTGPTAGATGRG